MCETHPHASRSCHCRGGLLRSFIQPKLLLELAKNPAHGYELMEILNQTRDLASSDPGNLYRILRGLEEDGFVRSNWDTSESGPARRKYELTKEGTEYLDAWVENVRETRQKLDDFLTEYESHFSSATKSPPPNSGGHYQRNECECKKERRKATNE